MGCVKRDNLRVPWLREYEHRHSYLSHPGYKFALTALCCLLPTMVFFPDITRDPATNSAQDFYRVTISVQLGIYNGVVLSWREKVRGTVPTIWHRVSARKHAWVN